MDRRMLMKIAAGSVVATAVVPGVASAATDFPPVPGMLGDRRANEFWYRFDEASMPEAGASQETLAAYAAMQEFFGGAPNYLPLFLNKWQELSRLAEYPANWKEFVTPLRAPLTYLSRFQLGLFDRFYRPDSAEFVQAFAWFGQGVLYDPRRADATSDIAAEIHTMDGDPPRAYHGWFAFMRAMIVLGIDTYRWTRIAPVVAFAWALQSIAKPSHREPNPGLPPAVVTQQAGRWLPRTVRQLDKDFQSAPYPEGIS